jgi:hypothetical protein
MLWAKDPDEFICGGIAIYVSEKWRIKGAG